MPKSNDFRVYVNAQKSPTKVQMQTVPQVSSNSPIMHQQSGLNNHLQYLQTIPQQYQRAAMQQNYDGPECLAKQVLHKSYAQITSPEKPNKLHIPILAGSPAIAFAKNHPHVLKNHKKS